MARNDLLGETGASATKANTSVLRRAVGAMAAVACWLLVVASFDTPEIEEHLPPQAQWNQNFAASPSYSEAIARHRPVWPPLYPSFLWLTTRAGIPTAEINLLLFASTLVLLVPLCRRFAPGVSPAAGIGLYALCGFNYWNTQLLFSEALLIPLALGCLLVLARALEAGRASDLVLLAGLATAACMTRYFAIFWLIPTLVLALAVHSPGARPERIRRALIVLAVASLPVGLWIAHTWWTTGTPTGVPRFESRGFAAHTTLASNLLYLARTFFLDFLQVGGHATHLAVGREWSIGGSMGIALAAASTLLIAGCAATVAANRGRAGGWPLRPNRLGLPLAFASTYFFWLVLLWTIGNNDPIYTRFAYPGYVFLLLTGLAGYASLTTRRSQMWGRPCYLALYAIVVVVQGLDRIQTLGPGIAFGAG